VGPAGRGFEGGTGNRPPFPLMPLTRTPFFARKALKVQRHSVVRPKVPYNIVLVVVGLLHCGCAWSAKDLTSRPSAAPNTVRESSYPITNLPTAHRFVLQGPRGSQEKQGLVWLDNHRVMFVGILRRDMATKGLYIWDVC
jgi:hypothetical protein